MALRNTSPSGIDLSGCIDGPVAVLGLGKSGLASATALLAAGIETWAWDDTAAARDRATAAGVTCRDLASADLGADLDRVTTLVLSPGIPHTHPAPHPVVTRARAAGCEILCDIELLARAQPAATRVGITGTNGKSTTTSLIGHLLADGSRPVEVGGNLGTPALALAPLDAAGVYVLELSSYQLELLPQTSFDVAVLLNISADHLDRHGGEAGYIAAKQRIFAGQSRGATAIVGIDDDASREVAKAIGATSAARLVPISGGSVTAGGVYSDGTTLIDDRDGDQLPVAALAGLPALPGSHNAQNAAAATAAAAALGMAREAIGAGLASYPGLAHRQQLVATAGDIRFVNDSKATNADAAARALACYDAVMWIAGGRAKEGGLDALSPFFARIREAFLIGEAAVAMDGQLPDTVARQHCGDLDTAVAAATAAARKLAATGTPVVVLLSPACASWDQFSSFEARGDQFIAAVERELHRELGGVA